ncbi:MAG: enoyl-CoA hydratase [Alphaproteobacteria bacterium]|nr:enoyl-CoA hydratase [Alphaproteobacteria bacterium]
MEYAGGRLITRVEGPIGWLVFNKPERLNAVCLDMWKSLPNAVDELDRRMDVRAVVVTGAGDRSFISGADIAEFERERCNAATNVPFTAAVTAATKSIIAATKPVIAAINGYCIGGGVVIASACDIRICTPASRFAVPAARLGLGYELDNYLRLSRLVGAGIAMEMVATGRHFTADEVHQARFVNRIVPADDLDRTVRQTVDQIAMGAPLTVAAAKMANRVAVDPSLASIAQQAIDVCFDSDDYKEGRAAFHDKRTPKFTGR